MKLRLILKDSDKFKMQFLLFRPGKNNKKTTAQPI